MTPFTSRLLVLLILVSLAHLGLAQRSVELSGIIESQEQLAEMTRVGIHIIDRDGVWGSEVATATPVAGTFSIVAPPLEGQEMRTFRSGAILLPGLQNEYRVSPEGVRFVQGRVNMYVDGNDSGVFDRAGDAVYIGVISLAEPVGFFSLLYVDRDATITGGGVTLELRQGWNIFSVRFPSQGNAQYSIGDRVDDVVITAVLP